MKDDRKTEKEFLEELQKALWESEARYRNILQNIEEGYYEVDLAGNFTLFNSSMSKILGYTEEEMKGMNNRQALLRKRWDGSL
jgi:PAS domain S-box-containing protein